MTSLDIDINDLPPLNVFLGSVAPGIDELEENIHFIHDDEFKPNSKLDSFIWPLTENGIDNDNNDGKKSHNNNNENDDGTNVPDTNTGGITKSVAKLHPTYLNIARPSLNPGPGIFESNTYVSLPFHVTNLFDKVIHYKTQNKSVDGGFQIGANVGSLMPDPFEYVHLNPGCLTEIIELDNLHRNNLYDVSSNEHRNPFLKLTNNFNKLLRLNNNSNSSIHHQNDQPHDANGLNNFKNFKDLISNFNKSPFFDKLINFDPELYYKKLNSVDTTKLLIACNINVINIITIDSDDNYANTLNYQSNKPYTSLLELDDANTNTNGGKKIINYKKSIEIPILRLSLHNNFIITTLKVFKSHLTPFLIIGLNSGEIMVINLNNLSFISINNFINDTSKTSVSLNTSIPLNSVSSTIINESVTSLEIINHPVYEFLIIAGYSNGEVIILNPFVNDDITRTNYLKTVVDKDRFVTYFKKFDLSPFYNKTTGLSNNNPINNNNNNNINNDNNTNISVNSLNPFKSADDSIDDDTYDDVESSKVIVGHFKLSHKPITTITSTISLTNPSTSNFNPMLVAIGSDDGTVKIINLSLTYNSNYGNNGTSKSLVNDIISNYFHDGIKDLKFSNDFKILSIVGNGDLIELFKLSYYNINSIINQANSNNFTQKSNLVPVSSSNTGRRSRSGTLNSINSITNNNTSNNTVSGNNPVSMFLSSSLQSPSTSLEITSRNHHSEDKNRDKKVETDSTSYPPSIKEIKLVSRLKSHTNSISKIMFIKNCQIINKNLEESKDSNSFYRLVSCGNDGRVVFWEFDYKALPKIRAPIKKKLSKKPNTNLHAASTGNTNNMKSIKSHTRTRSNIDEHGNLNLPSSFTNLTSALNNSANMNNLLNHPNSNSHLSIKYNSNSNINLNDFDQIKSIIGLYSSLFDIRLKKHYSKLLINQQKIDDKKNFNTIIHPIINNKLVPSIEIPLTIVDFTYWFKDGKISNIYLDNNTFWCMGKNGDIIKYNIE